jgi:hypothetical protein
VVNIAVMNEPARDEIFPLWPTWVGQMQLPGAEEQNRALAELAISGVDGNLFDHNHTAQSGCARWSRQASSNGSKK